MSNVRDFGAMGDGQHDDTEGLLHALQDGDGTLELPRGDYRLSRTLAIDLARHGRFALTGTGGTARLLMTGRGPAILLKGTHTTTADPTGFRPEEWTHERMPQISNVEIVGSHAQADGIVIDGVMQATLTGVLIRQVRHGVTATNRARNILISHCHIYHNTGVGVYLTKLNLHQIIITGSHISYCRLGGIRVEQSEIRNFQVTGNDIEYNNNRSFKIPGADAEPTAEIYIDSSEGSVREGTIASNTIQATYSKNGANIRFIGQSPEVNHKVGLWTIVGNLIGSQENNIHLTSARGVTISGNVIYSGHQRNLLIENSRNIVIGPNCFDHNPDYEPKQLCTGIRLVDSVDCTLSGLLIQDCQSGQHTVGEAGPQSREALVELVRCRRLTLSGIQIVDAAPAGLALEDCEDTLISGCQIVDSRTPKLMQNAIVWKGKVSGSQIGNCRLDNGVKGAVQSESPISQVGNLVV